MFNLNNTIDDGYLMKIEAKAVTLMNNYVI